jgi:hypothetical protein
LAVHQIGTAFLLAVHLALVDVAMIGPLAAAWYDWRGAKRGEPVLRELGRRLLLGSLVALVLGMALGGVLLAGRYFTDPRYMNAAWSVPRDRLWFALAELVFSLTCLAICLALWRRWQRGRLFHRLLSIAAATNLMTHFPALFTVISLIGTRPGLMGRELQRDEFRRLLIDGQVLSRVVHVWLAAVAVTGLVVVWLALRMPADENSTSSEPATSDESVRLRTIRSGARWAMTATMLQFPVGIWVTLAMPEAAREPLLGGDAVAALLFLGALALAMVLMHLLSALILTQPTAQQARRATAVLLLLVLLMVGTRLRLATHLTPAAPTARAQQVVAGVCEAGTCANKSRGHRPQLQFPAGPAAALAS